MSSQGLSSCDIRVCQNHSAGPFLVPFEMRFHYALVQCAVADDTHWPATQLRRKLQTHLLPGRPQWRL